MARGGIDPGNSIYGSISPRVGKTRETDLGNTPTTPSAKNGFSNLQGRDSGVRG